MPSPFPGMDPYVERPDLWVELHNPLMMYARDDLQPRLPEPYVARLELRIFTERETLEGRPAPRVPDLELVRVGAGGGGAPAAAEAAASGTRGFWVEAVPVERRELSLRIERVEDGELVTWVELLSPSNKRPGAGREAYLRKQREVLEASVNLVEIDLLRRGLHTVALPEEALEDLPRHDYRLCVRRAARPFGFWVDVWGVREPLPPVPIPLAPGEAELELNLQALFERAYENAAFRKLIDYRREPDPPLSPEDAAWADARLRAAGLRGDAGA